MSSLSFAFTDFYFLRRARWDFQVSHFLVIWSWDQLDGEAYNFALAWLIALMRAVSSTMFILRLAVKYASLIGCTIARPDFPLFIIPLCLASLRITKCSYRSRFVGRLQRAPLAAWQNYLDRNINSSENGNSFQRIESIQFTTMVALHFLLLQRQTVPSTRSVQNPNLCIQLLKATIDKMSSRVRSMLEEAPVEKTVADSS